MRKVMYLFDTLNRGGAETSTLEIAKRLNKFTPIIVTIFEGTDLKKIFEKAGIKVICLDFNSKKAIYRIYRAIEHIIDKEQPQIIHSNLFHSDQYARVLGKRKNIPIINSFVNDSYSSERYELLNFKGKMSLDFYKFLDRMLSGNVTHFISLTHAIIPNNATALNIKSTQVTVIPRGRDIKAMINKVDSDEVEKLTTKFGNKSILLTVSRLLIRKGYIESIKAIAEVIKTNTNIHYLIAGEGHDRKKIEALVKELDLEENVTLLGNCENIPTLLEAADLFVFPSHYEGQGGSLVEAMAFGKKIIATRIPVLEESVTDNYSALLFDYRNHLDLANKIIYALENPKEMEIYSENAREEAQKRFEIDKIVEKHELVYEKFLR
jgi:glycosyltransferase involved in cell wall biosynthesis